MVLLSTGLKASMMQAWGLAVQMNYGVIKIYSGGQPVSPNYAPTGLHLATITNNGQAFVPANHLIAGLQLQAQIPGSIQKQGVWQIKGETSGTAGWFRWYWKNVDTELFSTLYPRVDGTVGLEGSGSDMVLQSVAITGATDEELQQFRLLMVDIQV